MPLAQREDPARRDPAVAVPRLPHPSWGRHPEPVRRAAPVSAADFWTRLGL